MSNLLPLVPLLISLLFALKLSVIYLLAVYYDHVNPIYPFISDAGATHPEAGFFSMLLFLEAILIGVFGWIRYKQIRYVCDNNPEFNNNDKTVTTDQIERLLRYNKYGLYMSVLIMLSMSAVGAFRSTEHLELHLAIGAFPAFFASFAYFCIQAHASYKLTPSVNTLRIARFRLIITILAFIFGIIMITTIIVATIQAVFDGVPNYQELRGPLRLKWDESWGGLVAHVVSTVTENLMIFMMCPFFASFINEFRRISVQKGKLKYDFIVSTDL